MYDNIPSEIQEEILKRVCRVKSLLRFRSVSKQWKALIDSSKFINQHHSFNQKTQPPHLLAAYRVHTPDKYVSIPDDDSFPQNKFHPVIPRNLNLLQCPSMMLGCSHGLVCLYGKLRSPFAEEHVVNRNNDAMIVVWNPLLKTSFGIAVPQRSVDVLGFGVCPKTYDLKIIKITKPPDLKVEIFTLSTGTWRSMSIKVNTRLSLESIGYPHSHVEINGVIHWVSMYRRDKTTKIVTFDLTSEAFGEKDLPDGLSVVVNLFVYKPKECLAILNDDKDAQVCHVWIMIKNDDSKSSFVKLCTFAHDKPHIDHFLKGCRMNGQLIMKQRQYIYDDNGVLVNVTETLKVYDPSSRHMNDLEIDGVDRDLNFLMTSYTESLLMLNQPTVFQYPSS